ncbi:MAG: ferrous iron transport protein A [Deltaproteobacteria bacterium]|jgi:ferrous iron transport protein A|nr:ferrous iron transport protein A [Deltaproteobacteria bacterium]
MKNKLLGEFKPGETGIVEKLTVLGPLRRRLLDMGITPGTKITFNKFAPLGDPIEIKLRGYVLAIRKSEAQAVLMKMELKP